ncbi:MAG: nuclear transport factor 2 family protein [Saprospiraceae bacterium]
MKLFRPVALFATIFLLSFSGVYAGKVEDNIRAAYDALNRRDYAAFTKYVTPDFTEYAAGPEPTKTVQAAIEAYKMYFTAFPDLKFTIKEGTNDRYYVNVMLSGTNSGAFGMLPPTGMKTDLMDVDILTMNKSGLATSHWSANSNGMLTSIGYGSMTNPNTAVIMSAYEKFGKKDMPGILSGLTDDITFDIQDDILYTEPRMFKGKTGVTQFFTDLDNKVAYSKFQPVKFIADGNNVIVLIDAEFTSKATGRKYMSHYVHEWIVSNGKISSFKGVADLQQPEMMASH